MLRRARLNALSRDIVRDTDAASSLLASSRLTHDVDVEVGRDIVFDGALMIMYFHVLYGEDWYMQSCSSAKLLV